MRFSNAFSLFALYLFSVSVSSVWAQAFPFSLQNVRSDARANITTFDELVNIGVLWDLVDANGNDVPFTFTTASSTIELMAGTVAGAGNVVVDVPVTEISYTSETFSLRSSMPSGTYHMRITSIVNTTVFTSTIQTLVARGVQFDWHMPATVGCGPGLQPDPFIPITSVSSPTFTSFMMVSPPAGGNFPLSPGITFDWTWRNLANRGGQRISSFSLQVVQKTDGALVGPAIPIDSNSLFYDSTSIVPINIGMKVNQGYKMRVQYVNAVQDGTTPAGQVVTFLSDEFNTIDPTTAKGNCTAANHPPACPTSVNSAVFTALKGFEGFVPSPKPDPVKLPTVGYGHKCVKVNCTEVPYPFPLSPANATLLLQSDIATRITCINQNIASGVVLNQYQVSALTSFMFNAGCARFMNSTMFTRLNNGEDPNTAAAQEMPKYNKGRVNGTLVVLPGLVTRRAQEATLFQTNSSVLWHPCV
ncbi:lysozyme-like domain-containing protein [Mycena latifolia]|nr:lysozyme-like domain-containing protein [Mycena latifolia]